MQERRRDDRRIVSFPIRLNWKDENGKQLMEEGLTENIGPRGALVFLPHNLPQVGSTVKLTVTENADDEVSVQAQVLRLERNPSHPQAALQLTNQFKLWKEKVWDYATDLIDKEKPEVYEEW
jgi:hypothetical protein